MKAGAGFRGSVAFTLIELLVVIAIIGVLAAILLPIVSKVRDSALSAQSLSQIRQLVIANHAFANDNGGRFAPARDLAELTRWHGGRSSISQPFDQTKGYLSPYLGLDHRITLCPVLARQLSVTDRASFENGAGGYGYNAVYIGGTAADPFRGELRDRIRNASRTVMFASTAFAVSGGLQEYAFTEPYYSLTPSGALDWQLQPSTHFRHNGRAHIAWADGRVSAELPNDRSGPNYYNGDNRRAHIGWFGPEDHNGFWNPNR
jgi:prepilin-type N-terminal cleavage/methylation domain-containing protein/prepilin-type processing-associated H-X9-DG protein